MGGSFEFRILEMRISQIQYWIGLGNKDPTLRSTVFFKVQMLLSFVFCYSYEFCIQAIVALSLQIWYSLTHLELTFLTAKDMCRTLRHWGLRYTAMVLATSLEEHTGLSYN